MITILFTIIVLVVVIAVGCVVSSALNDDGWLYDEDEPAEGYDDEEQDKRKT